MSKFMLFVCISFLFLSSQLNAQSQLQFQEKDVAYPEVPRISVYEAYIKFKAGKAIIFHAGGEKYSGRRIIGAINLDFAPWSIERQKILQRFPKEGIEIYTYCY